MELGTFLGVLFTVFFFKVAFNAKKNFWISILLPPAIVFIFTGTYSVPTAIALTLILLIQYRKDKTRIILPNLASSWLSMVLSVGSYAFLYLIRPSNEPSVIEKFASTVREDFTYPIRFIFSSSASSVFTNQTLEKFDAKTLPIVITLLAAVIWFVQILAVVKALRSWTIIYLFPLASILYSIGIMTLIMVTRPTGIYGMFPTWYSLHMKIGLVGSMYILMLNMVRYLVLT